VLSAANRRAVAIGAGLGLLLFVIPITRFLLSPLLVIIHELGHATAGWLFGYPSIPAFDFEYGGGATSIGETQYTIIVGFVTAALLHFAWRRRRFKMDVAWILALTGLYLFTAFTDWKDVVVLAAGHGSELVFATVFLYRALSGDAVLQMDERPAYAMVGVFAVLNDLSFGWYLITSDLARYQYGEAKGGGHVMDFSQIAEDYLRVPLKSVATVYTLGCLVSVAAAWLLFRYQGKFYEWWDRTSAA